jgi:hypothetical protein
MIESRVGELERVRGTVSHLDSEMKEKDAEERIRFEVILRKEKLVEAEIQTFLEVWKREHDALTSRLASLTQASKTVRMSSLTSFCGSPFPPQCFIILCSYEEGHLLFRFVALFICACRVR